tara:strand:+ start:92 stop:583 length:492 start_codon:yes stop_codon:yes gene_type:complete
MHITLKKKNLYFKHYKIKCAIGKRGISKNKYEGDLCTPIGKFTFEYLLYRKDKIKNLKTNIPKKVIKKNMGWCDDPKSEKYNKLIKFPFSYKAEKLFLNKEIYDLLLVINYNRNPVFPEKGSAIFLHIASKNFKPTKGCIAIKKKDFLKILPLIRKKTKIIIN